MAEDKMAALEREVRLLRDSFNKLAGEWFAEAAQAKHRHSEVLAALADGRREVASAIDRLASALAEYNDGRRGPGNGPPVGPATVRKLTPRSKGKHGA